MLTRRETEVLRLLADGLTNREIAERLFISQKTVGTHVAHIFAKLDVHTRVEAAGRAQALGVLSGLHLGGTRLRPGGPRHPPLIPVAAGPSAPTLG